MKKMLALAVLAAGCSFAYETNSADSVLNLRRLTKQQLY